MNYRSHSGIVNAAGSIVELLEKFFPDSIDKLQRERSLTPGLNPIFFEGSIWTHRDTLFPKRWSLLPYHQIAFGSEQCRVFLLLSERLSHYLFALKGILVRDEKARERLEEEMGKPGLIFTIHESKGLEFNDLQVLIYNFFHDSDIDLACWTAVLNAVNSQSPLSRWHVPTFSESRHSGLCIELKILYVGITRARNKLWIADESDKGEPMRVFWSSRGLITNSLPNHTLIIHQSTPEQWKEKGDELFSKRHFKHAKQCYQKAELPHAVVIANAYALLQDAEQTPTSAAAESSNAFEKAATAFYNCSQDPRITTRKDVYLYEAGRCFEQSSNITEALKAYSLCKAYDQVARLCMERRMFDEACETILRYPEQIKEFERMKEKLRDHYFAEEDFGALHSLFKDLDEQIKHFNWKPSLKSRLLVYHNRFEEAAELERHEGNRKKAVELFLQARNYTAAKALILQALWNATSFKNNFTSSTCKFFDMAQDLRTNTDCWTRAEINELDMFGLILSSSSDERDAKLAKLGQAFNIAHRVLPCWSSLDQYFFDIPSRFQRDHDVFQIHDILVHFLTYVTSLKGLMAKERPMSDLAKLFGFRFSESQAEQVLVASSWHRPQSLKPGHPSFVPISNQHFAERARHKLDELLSTRLQVEEECLKSHSRFQPCLCSQDPTCDRFHVDPCRLNIPAYLACITGHLTQIHILSVTKNARGIDFPIPVKIFWMERIFRLLHCFGSSFTLAWDSNSRHKEALSAGIGIAKVWIREILLSYGFLPPASRLTFAISAMDFVTRFSEKESSLWTILPQLRQLTDLSERRTDRPLMPEDRSRQPRLPVDMYRKILKLRSEANQGLEFLCEVLQMNYSIDLESFFVVFERVCAVFTMSYYREKYQIYSGLILPRNWLYLATCTTVEQFQNGDLDKIHCLFKSLLEGLCHDQAFGQFLLSTDGYPEGLSDSLRGRFLLRTFTSVALVCLNIQDDHFISKILALTEELWWDCDISRYSPLVQRFFQVSDVFEMNLLALESLRNSPHQELIQVGMQMDPVPEGRDGVRLVTFRNFRHLHSMLSQPPEVPSALPEVSCPPPESSTQEGSAPASTEADTAPPSADALMTEPEPMAERSIAELPPESHIKACIIIEKYRSKKSHMHGAEAVSLKSEDTYEYHYCKCLEHVKSANLVHPPYKVRFLAAVPHLLLALHSAQDGLYARKRAIKKPRSPLKPSTEGEPVDFALLAEEQTKINSLSKVLGTLAAKVELTSDMHLTQDVNKLRETAHEALVVLRSAVALCPIDKKVLESIGELERVRL
ncbi:hypothetical protein NLJ89_g1628 [Agrocybe chaxingu]|uniref:UvrD-like helicase C-terminal domain-containing protein n=1 Tax=Agrocybe chaxingu TaxID=84603 RepID=A0A9W8TD50_9AGAR|nr:hypothetical protein NLJ89_g1628 [Agrocybe chaxingu]